MLTRGSGFGSWLQVLPVGYLTWKTKVNRDSWHRHGAVVEEGLVSKTCEEWPASANGSER